MKYFILASIISLTFLGCVSTHSGLIAPANVQLTNSNFVLVKTIDGFSAATYVFGIGGYDRSGLIKEAKKRMYSEHNFKKSQIITNVTLDEKRTWILAPIVYQKSIFISADVIQFGSDTEINLDSSITTRKSNDVEDSNKLKLDQVIYFKGNYENQYIEAKVIKIDYPFIDFSYKRNGKTIKDQKVYTDIYVKEGKDYRPLKIGK